MHKVQAKNRSIDFHILWNLQDIVEKVDIVASGFFQQSSNFFLSYWTFVRRFGHVKPYFLCDSEVVSYFSLPLSLRQTQARICKSFNPHKVVCKAWVLLLSIDFRGWSHKVFSCKKEVIIVWTTVSYPCCNVRKAGSHNLFMKTSKASLASSGHWISTYNEIYENGFLAQSSITYKTPQLA